MKVLLVHNRYIHEGGEERAVDTLASLLSNRGHHVQRFERSSQEWAGHPFWQRPADALSTVYSSSSVRALREELRRERPDIVHVHNVFPVLSPAVYEELHRHPVAVVQTLHNYRFMCANGLFLTPAGALCERCKLGKFHHAVILGCYQRSRMRTLPMALSLGWHRKKKTFSRFIHRFIAPSSFLKQKMVESGFPEERIHIVPNTAPTVNPRIAVAPSDLFVYVGRLAQEKGLRTLLAAFRKAPDLFLKIVGDGPLREELMKDHALSGTSNVEFLGFQNNDTIAGVISHASALIMPSECYENLPQAILEAWSCGTPVIASRLGGLAELVLEGENGWLFTARNPDDLLRALRQAALHVSDASLRQRCRDAITERFSPQVIYDQLLPIYERARQDAALSEGALSRAEAGR
jgi:glycosyltransferase involved in cell wall biosynthesis